MLWTLMMQTFFVSPIKKKKRKVKGIFAFVFVYSVLNNSLGVIRGHSSWMSLDAEEG